MSLRSRGLLSSVVDVHPHERSTIILMFAYSFLAMTSYNIIKPATRASFIVDLGAENLPFVMLAAGLLMGGLMHLYSRLVSVIPSRWVIPGTQATVIAISVAFWLLLRTGQVWVSAAFFFWGLLLGIFLISQFWTLANDLFDARQAKRLFGFIGGGASLGGMTGAATTALTAERFGTENLVLVSAVPLVVCFVVARYLSSHQPVTVLSRETSTRQLRGREALGLLRQSKHLRLIAGVIGFAAMSAVTLDQQLSMAAEQHVAEEDAITSFLAQVTVYISLIGFLIQVGLTSRIHRHLGIGFALLVLPVSLGATGVLMLLFPVLWAPALSRVLNSSLRYTLDKTSREILFLPLSPEIKHSAKPFVDVAVDRFMGKGLGSVVLLVLLKVFELTWYQLSYLSLGLMVLWIALARQARREYLMAFRRRLHARRFAPSQVDVPQADLATMDLLVEELGRPEEEPVLHAIEMLESLDRTQYVTPLLLRHHSPRVRARALEVLAKGAPAIASRWEPTVEHLLHDESADVRTAAVEALATIRQENLPDLMRPYLADSDPRVVAAAAIVLGESDDPGDVESANTAIEQLAEGRTAVRRTALKEVARAVVRIQGPRSSQHLIELLRDPDWEVVVEAIRQAQTYRDAEHALVPELVRVLTDRRLRHAARRALAQYGEDVVETLASSLSDRTVDPRVRWQLASTLTLIPCQRSVEVLLDALDGSDSVLRDRAALALGKLRRQENGLTFSSDRAEESAILTSARCLKRLGQLAVVRDWLVAGSLLGRAMREEIDNERKRLFALLSLMHPWREIHAAGWAIETGEQGHRASAVEYLDNLLSRRVRQHAMPVIEQLTIDDRGQRLDGTIVGAERGGVDEVLSSLILDDNPVVSLCAIEAVQAKRLTSLASVLEQIQVESFRDPRVVESAKQVLADLRTTSSVMDQIEVSSTLSVVRLLSSVPTLRLVPVKEIFRLADQVEQVRYQAGQTLFREGDRADRVELVLEGDFVMGERGIETSRRGPGALIGLEELLIGCPMTQVATATMPAVCVSRRADAFLALLSEHHEVTEGLFRFYLSRAAGAPEPIVSGARVPSDAVIRNVPASESGRLLSSAQKALLLERMSIFSHTSGDALLMLSIAAREIPLRHGATLCSDSDVPSMYVVLEGELSMTLADETTPVTAGSGEVLGIVPTLTRRRMGLTARVTREGIVLQIPREDLFDILGDHVGLLQSLFRALIRDDEPRRNGRRSTVTDGGTALS